MTNNETFGTSAQLSYIKLAALTAKWLCNFPLPPLHSLKKKAPNFFYYWFVQPQALTTVQFYTTAYMRDITTILIAFYMIRSYLFKILF